MMQTRFEASLRRQLRQARGQLGLREAQARPHFLGVGTQKGGTSTLCQLLRRHPEIFIPKVKEVHFFTKFYDRGEAWYSEKFANAPAGHLRGEITPYYLFHAAVPERIRALRGNMKIVVLLRHPVERTISQYYHSCRWKLETLPLEAALAAEEERLEGALEVIRSPGANHLSYQEHSYIARSRYEEQLPRYFELFGRDRVLVLRSEDLFCGNRSMLTQLERFLCISPFPPETSIPRANSGLGEARNVPSPVRYKLEKELAPTFNWLDTELGLRW
jgi:hypothetical protein